MKSLNVRKFLLILIFATAIGFTACGGGGGGGDDGDGGGDTVINIAGIAGVTPPATGETPVTTITQTAQYTGAVTWSGSPVTFAASTPYTATITLTAKSGYTLQGVSANFFTVAGATSVSNSADSGVVKAVFPATGATPPTAINIPAIPGVTAPVTGATPKTAITETAQYTGTIAWSGSPVTFAASTVYTATITLTAKPNYTLTGVAANYFTVAGATPSNPINSGVVTAVFPATGTATPTYNIGDTGPGGGIVFYDKGIYSDGWRYLEAAPSDMGSLLEFDTTYTPITTGQAIGTGKANTATITSTFTDTVAPAAWACKNATYGGKTDWFLPSKDELYELYTQRAYFSFINDGTFYVSSSEATDVHTNYVYSLDLISGPFYYNGKGQPYHVRAIRAF